MFDLGDRVALRDRLVEAARRDPEIDAAALLGSSARGTEDRWSDVDLALRLAPGVSAVGVADRWAEDLRRAEGVVDHLDVHASGALYRVFLLSSTLQVDLSFWPHEHFVSGGAPVTLLFGETGELSTPRPVEDGMDHVRMSWLYALHVRSALCRGRAWQAVWMLENLRNRLVSLYCLRHDLPTQEGRGVDALPEVIRSELAETLLSSTEPAGLRRTFAVLVTSLLAEASRQDLPVPGGLQRTLAELVRSADS